MRHEREKGVLANLNPFLGGVKKGKIGKIIVRVHMILLKV